MYGLPLFIYRAVQILTRLPDLDVGLVYTEGRAAHLQMRSDALEYHLTHNSITVGSKWRHLNEDLFRFKSMIPREDWMS